MSQLIDRIEELLDSDQPVSVEDKVLLLAALPAGERDKWLAVLFGFIEEAHELQCPDCGATVRARMAD